MKKKIIKKQNKTKLLKSECDALWSEIVKLKAGYKSEISGKEGRQIGGEYILQAHHLTGKSSLDLRYNIDNGICLTSGEHKFTAHIEGKKEMFIELVKQKRGDDCFEKLHKFKHNTSTKLIYYKMYLKQELEKLRSNI